MKKKTTKTKSLTAEELDEKFDAGENISEHLDYSKATRPGLEIKRTSVDFPSDMLKELDHQAALRGVTRQSLVKMWLYEKLEDCK